MSAKHDFTKSDEEIILLYNKGEKEMFKTLIDRYTSPIHNFVSRLTNRNDAPDILQEVFIKVWKNISKFDIEKASFKTWIFTIAKNTTTDFLRKKRNILFSDMSYKDDENEEINSFVENITDENPLPDETLVELEKKTEDAKVLTEMLEKLNPKYKEVLILHYQEEMTFEEIAKVLNKNLNTIKSQHRRALLELQKMIE